MDAFVPPYPARPTTRLPPLEMLRRMRRNLLELWHDRHFEEEVFATRLLRRRILVCNSPASVAEAFVANAAAIERKTPDMRLALRPLVGNGLIISDGAVWRHRRRVAAPVTHATRLPALAPAITAAAALQRDAWASLPDGTPVDMLAEMGALAARIVCGVVFGRPLDDAAANTVVAAFGGYQRRVGAGDVLSLLGAPEWLPRGQTGRVGRERRRIHAVLDRLIAEALARPQPGSLLAALVADSAVAAGRDDQATALRDDQPTALRDDQPTVLRDDQPTALRDDQPTVLRDEAATLFLAGQETTATTLAWAWYLLDRVPAAAARVRREAAALGGRAARLDDLPALPFTRAVIEETLRLYPPIPLLARVAARDLRIAGLPVRRGDVVMAVPWLLHRHRAWWPTPDAFRPERFLPEGGPRPPRHAFIPFGLGPRVCTGSAFAMAEMTIVLATLATRFAPALAAGATVFPVCRLTLRPGATLPMRLERP